MLYKVWIKAVVFTVLAGFLFTAPAAVSVAAEGDGARFQTAMDELRERNFSQARVAFERLSGTGHGGAAFMLGVLYEHGLGVTAADARAAAWYLKAAQRGGASAQYNLAVFHQLGRGVERSDALAFRWHRAAAAQGHRKAQNNLGAIYFAGAGVDRNLVEAWKWLTLVTKGLKGADLTAALQNRDKLNLEMSAEQLEEAHRRVSAWRPGA